MRKRQIWIIISMQQFTEPADVWAICTLGNSVFEVLGHLLNFGYPTQGGLPRLK